MPIRAKRPCPKCGHLTDTTPCDKCKKAKNKAYNSTRNQETFRFYKSAKWKKARAAQLSQYPLCAECQRQGRLTPADVVDHITRIEGGGAMLDPDNLQSLCASCHNRKTAYEVLHK